MSSNFGVARVSDPVFCENDYHGQPFPNPVLGKIIEGSLDTLCNDRQVARLGDSGTHKQCPGPNTFLIAGGATKTYVNDIPIARETDPTLHCGGFIFPGTSIGSITNGLGSPNTFCERS